jgi:exodeoxyribonuclease V alpha subunit
MTDATSPPDRLIDVPSPVDAAEQLMIEGELENIAFRNEESGFTVARLAVGKHHLITILGEIMTPTLGEHLRCWGHWETHRTYGPQFRIERYQVCMPATADAMERYLSGGLFRGVKEKTARALVKRFGTTTLDIIEKEPHRLLEVPGIGPKKAREIADAWLEQRESQHIMLFLQGHGISAAYATRIYREYGDRAMEVVTANPYRLARDIFGVGFRIADRIALKLGHALDMPERVEAGVLYALAQAQDQGHCYLPEETLAQEAAGLLATPMADGVTGDGSPPTVEGAMSAIERLVRSRLLIRDVNIEGQSGIYVKPLYVMEHALAHALLHLRVPDNTAPAQLPVAETDLQQLVEESCAVMGITPAEAQRTAVLEALRSRVLILTGGPGTGKTTTTRAILRALQAQNKRVLLASPTGRASKRLSEVTGSEAKTIHRLLEVDPKTFTFKRDAQNPLTCDALIVDEVSMLDLKLAFSIVRALPPGAQLILVGDADQLPSVGAGNVLHDLIRSGVVPVVRLTEIFRQAAASHIITNAHLVNRGQMPNLRPTSEWQTSDCLMIKQDDAVQAAQKIADVVARSLPSMGYRAEDVQVLTPMQRGTLGALELNRLLQETLNPPQLGVAEVRRGQQILRVGDRVIQTVNDYNKDVFNGDIGYVRHIDFESKTLVVAFPEKDVPYSFEEIEPLALAYALTVHKSQGSEYPAVVQALHTQHYLMLQRNLLYTALTRARKLAVVVGSPRAIAIAVRNDRVQTRFTRLAERLMGDVSPTPTRVASGEDVQAEA